jgi:hypothetical protein
VEPLLSEGEHVSVIAGPSEYPSNRGPASLRFDVTIVVGPTGDEQSAERLDELLSGSVKAALEDSELRPAVTKTSGYQNFPGEPPQLGASWSAVILD